MPGHQKIVGVNVPAPPPAVVYAPAPPPVVYSPAPAVVYPPPAVVYPAPGYYAYPRAGWHRHHRWD